MNEIREEETKLLVFLSPPFILPADLPFFLLLFSTPPTSLPTSPRARPPLPWARISVGHGGGGGGVDTSQAAATPCARGGGRADAVLTRSAIFGRRFR